MNELPLLVVGVIAAGVQGAVFPSFSIFFGRALEAFTFPFNQVGGYHVLFSPPPPLLSLAGLWTHPPVGGALSHSGLCVGSFHSDQECCIFSCWGGVSVPTSMSWTLTGFAAPT